MEKEDPEALLPEHPALSSPPGVSESSGPAPGSRLRACCHEHCQSLASMMFVGGMALVSMVSISSDARGLSTHWAYSTNEATRPGREIRFTLFI